MTLHRSLFQRNAMLGVLFQALLTVPTGFHAIPVKQFLISLVRFGPWVTFF